MGYFSILFSPLPETFLFLKEKSFTDELMLAFLFLMIIMKEKGG
jgi:hypothetical protein